MYKTFKYRIKDSNKSLSRELLEMGFAVNRIWNYANEQQKQACIDKTKWPSEFDLNNSTTGLSKLLRLPSDSIQEVTREYATRRTQFKKSKLNWRSNRKSLTWIPCKARSIKINRETGRTTFRKLNFDLFYSRPYEGTLKTFSITRDSRFRFYLNLTCDLGNLYEDPNEYPWDGEKVSAIGIDLGLKSVVTTSEGQTVKAPRYFRQQANRLAKAQRAKKKKQVRNIHAKIKNQRLDFNHKLSSELVNKYDQIFIGDVKPSAIIKTKSIGMAKSVYDVSWFQLKSFLLYKASAKGKICQEVSEKYSTQTCSECGVISKASPKGKAGLNIREWTCPCCGTILDRDINAAKNILRSGHRSLLEQNLVTN